MDKLLKAVDRVLLALGKRSAPVRLLGLLGLLGLLWLPLAIPVWLWIPNPNLQSWLILPLLYGGFIGLVRRWGRVAYGDRHRLATYGLRGGWLGRELLGGLGLGCALVGGMYAVQAGLGWCQWRTPSAQITQIVLEGAIVGLAIGFAEELLFRGWMLEELRYDYGDRLGVAVSALVFASLHFLKPWDEILRTWPQFAGLVTLGLVLAVGKRWRGDRLGFPLGLHGGLVWGYYMIQVGQMIQLTPDIPAWITGINGNPLAGAIGLTLLLLLLVTLQHLQARRSA